MIYGENRGFPGSSKDLNPDFTSCIQWCFQYAVFHAYTRNARDVYTRTVIEETRLAVS